MFTRAILLTVFLLLAATVPGAAAPPWIWDSDQDGLDDRIVDVETVGIAAAYRNQDPGDRLLFDVSVENTEFLYGLYVKFDHPPTAADELALQGVGLNTHRYQYIPYVRTRATLAQAQQVLTLPGVLRVETIPIMYASNDNGTQTMQAAPSNFSAFPSVHEDLGITGKGVVIAVLDTGVNDEPVGSNPGHESLQGKFLGGGTFWAGQPELNTGLTESINPQDQSPDFSHGSHVAGTAMGTGGPSGLVTDGNYGYYRGVAPDARLVDCKALSDAGTGFGAADALEWCIFNKTRDWGTTGADSVYRGIQVVNMSLGSSSASDGTDASAAAVNAAVKAGLIVCVASGNDGNTSYIPSPASADLGITVGASIDYNTLDRLDDIVASFSNEGPRDSDSDGDLSDEMKPDLCTPGAAITSVEGVSSANGHTYTTVNGTSMACPMTAGLAALIVEACPGIDPLEVKRILRDTADHRTTGGKQPPSAVDPYGIDANYHPSWGWGNGNAYAAVMEARFPNRTQVIRESGEAVAGGMDVRWTTQREVDFFGFHILRADPVYGEPGPFQRVNPALIPAGGDPYIHAQGNRTTYLYEDRDPSLVPGRTYWYRVQWEGFSGDLHEEPAFPVVYDPPVPLATLYWSITHNTPDNDLLVFLGSGHDASDPVNTASFFIPGPGTGAADTSYAVPGEATTGNQRHEWSLTLTDQDFGAAQFLPPGPDNPWFLFVNEAGFVNRMGRVEDFRIVVHTTGGDVEYTPLTPFPVPHVEKETTTIWIPQDPGLVLGNSAPVLDPIGARSVQEGRTLEFVVTGSDPDGDPITLSAAGLPSGAAFDAPSGTFSWSLGYGAVTADTDFTVTFGVSDGLATDSEDVTIRVHDVDPASNLAPYFEAINDQSVVEGNILSFKVRALDAEEDSLTYAAGGLPAGATFDAAARCFEWPTQFGDGGDYTVFFTVTDGLHPEVSEEVQITVKGSISPPLEPCESEIVLHSGTSSTGSTDAGTADHDTVTVSLPAGAVRLVSSLSWTGSPLVDLDFRLYDAGGSQMGAGASLGQPESIIVDNLPPGVYRFVVEGYLVPTDTDWTLQVDACATAPVPVMLSHFTAHTGEGQVRLEWSTSREENHLGFHVYRSVQRDEGYARIDEGLITGRGVYEFVDRDPLSIVASSAFYRVTAIGRDGSEQLLGPWEVDLAAVRPIPYRLLQSFPNPWSPAAGATTIRFQMARAGEVRVDVFDIRGARVQRLFDGALDRGDHEMQWDGSDGTGRGVAAGVYFYRLEVPGAYVETRRMVVTR